MHEEEIAECHRNLERLAAREAEALPRRAELLQRYHELNTAAAATYEVDTAEATATFTVAPEADSEEARLACLDLASWEAASNQTAPSRAPIGNDSIVMGTELAVCQMLSVVEKKSNSKPRICLDARLLNTFSVYRSNHHEGLPDLTDSIGAGNGLLTSTDFQASYISVPRLRPAPTRQLSWLGIDWTLR
jgi:hypothetical protein